MKAEVTSPFRDKLEPTRLYTIGEVYEGDEARIAELVATKHVRPLDEPEGKPKPKRRATRKRTTKE